MSFLVIGTCSLANFVSSCDKVFLIDGQKFFIWSCKYLFNLLLLKLLKHLITLIVFSIHLCYAKFTISVLIWPNFCLLILPISFLDKSISLVVQWLVNFSLWSFRVIKELPLPFISILCLIKMTMGSHNNRSN